MLIKNIIKTKQKTNILSIILNIDKTTNGACQPWWCTIVRELGIKRLDNEKYSHGPWRAELPLTHRDKRVTDECDVVSMLIKKHANRSLRRKSHITPSVSTAQIQASAFGATTSLHVINYNANSCRPKESKKYDASQWGKTPNAFNLRECNNS